MMTQDVNLLFDALRKEQSFRVNNVDYSKLILRALVESTGCQGRPAYSLSSFIPAFLKSQIRKSRRLCDKSIQTLIIDDNKVLESGESFYFKRIKQELHERHIPNHVVACVPNLPLHSATLREFQSLKNLLSTLRANPAFYRDMCEQIERIFYDYLIEYGQYRTFLSQHNFKRVLFTCHYGKEGLIQACNDLGITTIEIQHGLIDKNSIFYCFGKSKCFPNLFPAQLLTYGEYWANLVLPYKDYKKGVVCAGDYIANPDFCIAPKSKPRQKVILICVQKEMRLLYFELIQTLLQSISEPYSFLLRLHPGDSIDNNTFYKQTFTKAPRILISNNPLIEDFLSSQIHLSFSSTTLYEATKFPIHNIIVMDERDPNKFGRSITSLSIAVQTTIADLRANGLPIQVTHPPQVHKQSSHYFASFPTGKFSDILTSWQH